MKPKSEAELAEMVATAKAPLRIVGGGTRNIAPHLGGAPLSTAGITGVSLYEPGALTLVAAAGTPVSEIDAVLANEGQRLAFEPMDHRGLLGTQGTPTIGGVVAANVSGPRRIQAGAARDSTLGVRFVDGAGRSLKNGGRVMKNVTGYDLVKLMAGSWGTLGVLSEVSLKVQAIPETAGCVLLYGLSEMDAVRALSQALGSPYDVSGAAHAPVGIDGHPVTMVRVEGLEASVSYRTEKLKDLLADTGAEIHIERSPDRLRDGWAWVRDVAVLQGGDRNIWRFSVKPSDAPHLVAELRDKAADIKVMYDWGGGLVWISTARDLDMRPAQLSGHATLVRASDQIRETVPVFQPEQAPIQAISKGLRAEFDPRGILNPGLMG
ncbi:FAD-binding protein [Shimia sp.]|uniref:FAD-binding protein n=1 Tax=Shimia sp. TaxID=1954381 RepID=UPI0032969786